MSETRTYSSGGVDGLTLEQAAEMAAYKIAPIITKVNERIHASLAEKDAEISRLRSLLKEAMEALERCQAAADKRKTDALNEMGRTERGAKGDYLHGVIDASSNLKCEIAEEARRARSLIERSKTNG